MSETPPTDRPVRLLVIPGLDDSGPAHWQTWLEARLPGALRVQQRNWRDPDLPRWSGRIDSMLARQAPARWVAVAHSFGALALVEHLGRRADTPIAAALLVAPADPAKFGLGESLPQQPLGRPAALVASSNDPWLAMPVAARWAARWGCPLINLGPAGHINAVSGHGPLPLAEDWVRAAFKRLGAASAPSPRMAPMPFATATA